MIPVGIFLLLASVFLRIIAYPVVTSDYTYFLSKWFDALHTPGLSAFTSPFADYAPLYLYFIKLLTFFPVPSLYSIKTLSVVFDIGIAGLVCFILYELGVRSKARLFLAFAIVFAVPTMLVNSAMWGQSDSPYAFFVLLSLYFILKDKPIAATLAFSVALCFKVQAIFFLPVLFGYLFRRKEDLPYILLVPFVYILSIIPAWLGGGSFWYWLTIYSKQSSEYTDLSVSAQSAMAFIQPMYLPGVWQHVFFWAGVVLALCAALYIALLVARTEVRGTQRHLILALLCAALLPYLLPRMHERYFYLADVLAVLYALYVPRAWYMPVLVVGSSLLSYQPFLSQLPFVARIPYVDLRMPAVILFAALVCMYIEQKHVPENLSEPRFRVP
jgi:Gpi18-like mannosyltransferase